MPGARRASGPRLSVSSLLWKGDAAPAAVSCYDGDGDEDTAARPGVERVTAASFCNSAIVQVVIGM